MRHVILAVPAAVILLVVMWLQPVLNARPAPAYSGGIALPAAVQVHELSLVRRMTRVKRRHRRVTLGAASTVLAYPAPPIAARAAILEDLTTGKVLYARHADERLPMASTTKITTAILALQQRRLNDLVTVSRRAASIGESTMALRAGERVTVRQLLYGLLLNSGNDAAIALAEHVDGTVERFVRRMNGLARVLHLRNTHYVTPHGLDAPGHYTSARDLATVARYAMRDPEFRRIVSTYSYYVPATRHNSVHWLASVNRVMYWYPGIDGIKPGDTDNAGLCQVVTVQRDGHQLLAVLLNTPTLVIDIRNLLNFGLHDFRWVGSSAWWDAPYGAATGGTGHGEWMYVYGAGHYIRGPFLHYFRTHGGLQTLGYPRTEQLRLHGTVVQFFQGGELALDAKHGSAYPVALNTPAMFVKRVHANGRVAPPFALLFRSLGGRGVFGKPASGIERRRGLEMQRMEFGGFVTDGAVAHVIPEGDLALRRLGWLPAHGAGDAFPPSMDSNETGLMSARLAHRSTAPAKRHVDRFAHRSARRHRVPGNKACAHRSRVSAGCKRH